MPDGSIYLSPSESYRQETYHRGSQTREPPNPG